MKSTECLNLPMVCFYVLLALVGSVSSSRCSCSVSSFYCTSQGLTYIPSNVTCRDGVYDENSFVKGPRNYFSIQNFRTIILKKNRINLRGSNVFRRKSSVQFLDISENKLDSLGSRVFEGLTQLTLLNLTNSGIRALQSDTFSNLLSLHELFLCGNHISSLPPQAFLPLVNLTFLRLDGNSIISLSYGMFATLHRLRKLNLANNQLEGIEKHNFEGLVSLEQLNLSRNNIKRIDHELTQRIECQEDTLSNAFRYGDNEHCFDDMINLKEIDLTNNSLTTLNAETFLCNPNLSKLHLSGNPFRCKRCRMKKVVKQVCEAKGICSDELTCRNKRKNLSNKSSYLPPNRNKKNKKIKKKHRGRKEKKQKKRNRSFHKSSTPRPTTTTMINTTKSSNVEILKTTTESPSTTTEPSQTTLLLPTTTSSSDLPTQVITSSKSKQLQTNHGDENADGSIRKIPATSGDLEIVLWLIVSSVIAGISAILVCITMIAFCSRYNRSLEEIKNIPPQAHCELKRESLSSLSYNPLALRPLPEEPKTDVESVIDGASICGDDVISNDPPVYNRDKVHLKWITRGTFSLGKFNRHDSANFEQNIDIPTFPALPSRNDTRRSSNNATKHHHAPLRKVESSDDNTAGRRVK